MSSGDDVQAAAPIRMRPYPEQPGERYGLAALPALAKRTREEAGLSAGEVAERLGATAREILGAERRAGPAWVPLQRQIVEWCSGHRLEADVRYYLHEDEAA